MDGLCSGDLADITGGTLRLGTLPPLGGAWEPIRRVVTTSHAVVPGDVYWDLTEPRSELGASVWEAFARGALGVVTAQPTIEPWAGAFVVQVQDSRRALRDVGCWARRRYRDHIVALCCSPRSPLPQLVACICHSESFGLEGGLEGDSDEPSCSSLDTI
jgi:UDP-N-acetylmuramyl pentapeptide synthase